MGKLLPKEEGKIGVVQLVGVGLRRPPVVLRRGGGASMVGEMGKLLHGFARERGCLGRVGGRERERA